MRHDNFYCTVILHGTVIVVVTSYCIISHGAESWVGCTGLTDAVQYQQRAQSFEVMDSPRRACCDGM